MNGPKPGRDARIAVVGAGPAGLSAAWFLKANGFRNVTVLEKAGRIGGLCLSITENYQTYDIGANYVTMEYQETLKIARTVGAKLYFEDPYSVLNVPPDGGPTHFTDFLTTIRTDDATGKVVPILKYMGMALKYLWLRLKCRRVIDPPTFAKVADEAPELAVPFSRWLASHGLEPLSRLFEIPVTIMGYGHLNEIAAPYVLKYIGPRTFVPMLFFPLPVLRYLFPWPKRFVEGFGRMWERVSWGLNVRLNADISSITRTADGVTIRFREDEQILDRERTFPSEMAFDYLIMACPLSPAVTEKFLDLGATERDVLSRIKTNTYTMFTATVNGLNLPAPIAVVYPQTATGTPWGVTQQYKSEGSFVTQFYLQLPGDGAVAPPDEHFRETCRKACQDLVRQMGGTMESEMVAWQTFDAFPYFQHVTTEDFGAGWYARLEALQGTNRTCYVGGATNFELVEPIVRHSKHVVDTHFPPVD
jgi:hypothetical protein